MGKRAGKVVEELNKEYLGDGMFRGPELIARKEKSHLNSEYGVRLNEKKIERMDVDMGTIEARVRGYGYRLGMRSHEYGPLFLPDY